MGHFFPSENLLIVIIIILFVRFEYFTSAIYIFFLSKSLRNRIVVFLEFRRVKKEHECGKIYVVVLWMLIGLKIPASVSQQRTRVGFYLLKGKGLVRYWV